MNAPIRKSESTALTTAGEEAPFGMEPMRSPGSTALILDPRHMTQMMALAEMMAKAVVTVPQHMRGKAGDCLAVVMQATQWGMNPFAVAQKTHLVNGTLGYEAQLVNAVVNTMAPTKDRINYEWFGDWNKVMGKFEERESKKKVDEDTGKPLKYRTPSWGIKDEDGLGIRVWATMKGETEPRTLELLLVQCRVRNSPLWADDPRQQIAYLAVKRWTRLHCPDVLLGVFTPDELAEQAPPIDMGHAEVLTPAVPDELLTAAKKAAASGVAGYQQFWQETGAANRGLLKTEHDALKKTAFETDAKRTVNTTASPAPASAAPASAAPITSAAAPAQSSENIAPTYASVMEKMVAAHAKRDVDALDIAADWIKEVDDAEHRQELDGKYDAMRAELTAA